MVVNLNDTDPLKIDKIMNPMLSWYICTISTNFQKQVLIQV